MLPQTHTVITLIFSAILILLGWVTPLQALIILLAGVTIDIDHWLVYVFKKKGLNVKKAYKWMYGMYIRNERRVFLYIFHTIEAYALMILLAYLYPPFFLYVLIGAAFHSLLDFIDAIHERFYGKRVSLIYSLIKKNY